jgi:uncharacterized protein YjbI with pentapeptide repeats
VNTIRLLADLALTSTLIVGCSGGSAAASQTPTPAVSSTTSPTAKKGCTAIEPFADLKGCDFTGADLLDIHLNGANLTGANLIGALLQGAVVSGANFSDSILTGALMPDGTVHP